MLVAIEGIVLPLALGFSLSYRLFGLSLLVSLFVGGTLTATSIGVCRLGTARPQGECAG